MKSITWKKPYPILRTYLGNVIYTPKALENEIPINSINQVDISELLSMDFKDITMKNLHKANLVQISLLSIRHSEYGYPTITAAGSQFTFSFDSHCGRKKYNIEDIIYRMKLEQPTYYIAPADEVLLIA